MTNGKAVFLDRDGTLIRDKNYLSRPADVEYFPDTFPALRLMRQKGYALYVITNQSGVGRGFFTMREVDVIHRLMNADLTLDGQPAFDGVSVCPHAPDQQCNCRKPEPKLVLEFVKRDQLDVAGCWMVGDKTIDAECGLKAGMRGAIVRHPHSGTPHPYFATLLEFAQQLP